MPEFRLPWVSGLAFLFLRGFLLWILVPVTALAWLLIWPYWYSRKVGCAQLIGWADVNLAAALQRTVFRPLVRSPLAFVAISAAPEVTHRVLFIDPV
jgi:hypothetical protein